MLVRVCLIILFCLMGFGFTSVAQTDTLLAVPAEEFVTVFKDSRLDILDKRPALIARLELEERANAKKDKDIPLYKPIVSADGKKKVTGSIYTTKGFKIVIYNGPDRAAAMKAKNEFAKKNPGISSVMSYNSPSYKIKIGDFTSRNDAAKFMRKLNSSFPTSFIVPDIITVKNINVIN
jgi:hypothetical protein